MTFHRTWLVGKFERNQSVLENISQTVVVILEREGEGLSLQRSMCIHSLGATVHSLKANSLLVSLGVEIQLEQQSLKQHDTMTVYLQNVEVAYHIFCGTEN